MPKSSKVFACSLKDSQIFFIQSFPRDKLWLFSIWSNAQMVDTKCLQGIIFPIFVAEGSSGLFSQLSTFFNYRFNIMQKLYKAFYFVFSYFVYWINSNTLFCWVGKTITQKSFFLHTFPRYLSLFSVLK